MPRHDHTGPQGRGPRTGHRGGDCAGAPPDAGYGHGFGRGRRRHGGFGHGGGRGAYALMPEAAELAEIAAAEAPLTPDEQRRALKAERNRLKAALAEVEAALHRLGPPSPEPSPETGS